MTGITLSIPDAKLIAAALLPHTAPKGDTPVLRCIVIRDGFAYASDRYTDGRYDLTNLIEDLPDEDFMIPGEVFSAIQRGLGDTTLPNTLFEPSYRVRIETVGFGEARYIQAKVVWTSEDLGEMLHWCRTWDYRDWGKFPVVDRLFNDVLPGTRRWRVQLGPEHLSKFLPFAKLTRSNLRLTMTGPKLDKVASPILVECGTRFKGLVQPTLEGNGTEFGTDLAVANATARDAAEAAE